MTTAQCYLSIPKEERARLTAEVIKLPKVRGVMIVCFVIAGYGSSGIAKITSSSITFPFSQFITEVLVTGMLAAAFAIVLVRPLVRIEVVKAKKPNQ